MRGRGINATTSRRMRDYRGGGKSGGNGDGASIGLGCAFRDGGRVEEMRGGGINATTSRRTRGYRGGGKSDGDGDGECPAPSSRDLVATALVLTAEAATALIAYDADGGNSSVAIISSASLTAGGGVVNEFILVFVVDMIISTGW
jgi:hypothetical protein